jgi:DNA primase
VARTRTQKFPIEPILDYLGQIIPGGRRSGKVKAKCSFHDDTVASAVIDYQHQRFRCFACDESGDAIELLMRHEGLKFEAAKHRAAELAGQEVAGIRKQQSESRDLFGDTGIYG